MSDRVKLVLAVLLVLGALGLCALNVRTAQKADNGSSEFTLISQDQAQAAPAVTLPDATSGTAVNIAAIARSRPVVLEFWATWCGPCRAEMPHVAAVSRKYAGRVAFYGVNSNDSRAKVNAFLQTNHVPFPTLLDSSQTVAQEYGASSIPLLILIDTHNRVRLAADGFDPEADIEHDLSEDLDTLLQDN